MSIVPRPPARKPRPASPKSDPYYYGWRYVQVVAPDGTVTFNQVPLTLHDVLFPKEDDFVVQTEGHVVDVIYLRTVFKARLQDDSKAAVVTDCLVDWNIPGVEPLGPDIA